MIATREGPKKSYCVGCFVDFCHRTTRDALFRNCSLPPDIPVVIAVSGGFNSMALLHLMGVLRQQNSQRGGAGKIDFRFRVLHLIEDGIVVPRQEAACEQQEVAEASFRFSHVADTIHRFATTTLVEGQPMFASDEIIIQRMEDVLFSDENASKERAGGIRLYESRAPTSDVEDAYAQLKTTAIALAAQRLVEAEWETSTNLPSVSPPVLILSGDNGVRCCCRALGDLARGRGARIPESSGFRGTSVLAGVQFLRPIRCLLPKETLLYCRQQGIPFASLPTFNGYGGPWRSLNTVLEAFMTQLMGQFPSTPFNVLNSVTKLAPMSNSAATVSETASVASSQSQPSKVIMTKASRQNYLDCLGYAVEATTALVESQHGDADATLLRSCCVFCGSALPTEAQEASLHSSLLDCQRHAAADAALAALVRESEALHNISGGNLCLGCRVVWRAMSAESGETDAESSPSWGLQRVVGLVSGHHSGMAKAHWRRMTSAEVATEVAEFLLPEADDQK